MQALTVGSITCANYETEVAKSMSRTNEPSPFSRSGAGIWNSIKPDVVEYGGTWVKSKQGKEIQLTALADVCPELLTSFHGTSAFAKDAVGTSFSTPKIAYIAAEIQKRFPHCPALLYRALIAQSARWPIKMNDTFAQAKDIVKYVGYGLPDVIRATQNDNYRITFVTQQSLSLTVGQAHIFTIPIPEPLYAFDKNYNIQIDITLSYAAKPRNTSRTIPRYLSTWLDWRCSKAGESIHSFVERILVTGCSVRDRGNFNWAIGEQSNYGQAKDFSRSACTLQKDWTIIKSNQLTDSFGIAVRGHKGWDANEPAKYSLVVSFEAIDQNVELYKMMHNRCYK